MEDTFDSLQSLSRFDDKAIYKEGRFAGTTSSNEEATLERLICQLADGIPSNSSSGHDVQEMQNCINLEDPLKVDEILDIDEVSIAPTCHNVSVINAACQHILKQMELQLVTLLRKNRKEQEIIQNFLNTNCKNSTYEILKKPSLKCAGMPYFKDPYGFQQPPNEDVLRKQENKKLLPIDFIKSFPVWNSTDAKKLLQAIHKFDVSKPSTIDWMKISVTDMEGKYSPSECKAKWTMHLNPSINKSRWSLKEMSLLKELSAKYNYQNWDKIADELNTGRNGLQCCIQYQTHTAPTEGKWTKEEDESLKKLVEKFRIKDYIPWKKVAWHFEERSLKQCQERYAYHLDNIKKGNFTMEEDFIIVYLASKLKNFGEVAKFIPNRVSTQVRSRYEYLVQLSMPEFTKEEDELLTKLMIKYPRNWGKISENFKNRSRIQCRRRWAYLQRKIHLDIDSDHENDECCDSTPDCTVGKSQKSLIDEENVKKNIHLISKPGEGNKKYSEIYSKLLNYHKNCHKFLFGPKPRIPSNAEDLKKLTNKMILTMKNLSITHTSPLSGFDVDELSSNCEFDKEDLAVLKGLFTSEQESSGFELSSKIIPPNFMTLVGVRTITLGWNAIQDLTAFHKEVPQVHSKVDPDDRILCSDAKKLFKSRLKTIFAFPLILSNISSVMNKKPPYKPKGRKTVKPLSKRKRKEHAKLMNAAYKNKLSTLIEKFEDRKDVGKIRNNTQLLESSAEKVAKSEPKKRASKSSANSEIGGKKSEMNGSEISRKRTHSVKTDREECETFSKKRRTRNARQQHST